MRSPRVEERRWASLRCLRTRFDLLTFDEAVDEVIRSREYGGRAIHLCNAFTATLAARDDDYAATLERGDLNLPDGMPLAWLAQRAGLADGRHRVPGPDLMQAVVDRGRERGLRHYLYGAEPDVLSSLVSTLRGNLAGLELVGAESPPFRLLTPIEEDQLVQRVEASSADVVWVGLGTPKQDVFVDRFRDRCGVTLVAVGAAFDFLAGARRRAPEAIQRAGLEWAYRLATEPRRLWRRYLIGNAQFVAGVIQGGVEIVDAGPFAREPRVVSASQLLRGGGDGQ